MNDTSTRQIWDPNTGIAEIEDDPNPLGASEMPGIKAAWTNQRERLKGTAQLSDFIEKLTREWAIETGIIEHLYEIDRGVTRTLIERGLQAEFLTHGSTNKPREYVIALLRDQKAAIEGVFDFVKNDRSLSVSFIKELHAVLLRSQHTIEALDSQGRSVEIPLSKGAWKTQPNHPVRNGVTYTYCAPEHVASEMDRLIEMHTEHVGNEVPSDVQAAWLHHRFTQIHPFQDGNGRVARAVASLVLVKDGLFPLVVTRDDNAKYLDALEAADSGDLKPLIDLIAKLQIAQFRKATAISEALLAEGDEQAALDGLLKAADQVARDRSEELKGVFDLAQLIEDNLVQRLEEIVPDVLRALQKVAPDAAGALVTRSGTDTGHYFRAQIINNARNHIGYFANTEKYRSWVALNMRWTRGCKLVFATHGFGRPFNGSLVCAPFLEFKDTDEENEIRSALIPVTEDGFVFFHDEDRDRLLARFEPWRRNVLTVALGELTRNLNFA